MAVRGSPGTAKLREVRRDFWNIVQRNRTPATVMPAPFRFSEENRAAPDLSRLLLEHCRNRFCMRAAFAGSFEKRLRHSNPANHLGYFIEEKRQPPPCDAGEVCVLVHAT